MTPQNEQLFTESLKDQILHYEPKNKTDFFMKTKAGIPTDICVSGLQKCIRRGMEVEAGYFASELYEIGWVAYLLMRLVTIAHEDVGDPTICIHALQMYTALHLYNKEKKKWPDKNIVMRLVLDMCRCVKDREGDDFKVYVEELQRKGWMPNFGEYMVDIHTKLGRERIGNIPHEEEVKLWKTELTKVNEEKPGNKYKDLWTRWK